MRAGPITIVACVLLTLLGCAKQDTNSQQQNDPAARDAAPGPLSETSPPSTDEEGKNQPPPP